MRTSPGRSAALVVALASLVAVPTGAYVAVAGRTSSEDPPAAADVTADAAGPTAGPGTGRDTSAPAPTATPPGPPAPAAPCRLTTATGTLALTEPLARGLTTLAAVAVRDDRSPAALAGAARRLLAAPATAVDPADADAWFAPARQPPTAQAEAVAAAVGGRSPAALTCAHARDRVEPERPGRSGLTPRAGRLLRAYGAAFGELPAGGYAAGGVDRGHVDDSAHYDGRAVDVFFRPVGDTEQRRRGWVFAQWAVAHADAYDVLSVIYADRIWTSWAAGAGWRPYVHPSGNRRNPVLRHLDHVHVAVESGRPWRGD